MIVNKYSVLSIFISSLGLGLAIALAAVAAWAAFRIIRSKGELDASRSEKIAHLAVLVLVVCLAMQAIGWPLLYAMLNNFVPEIPGAMCIYGVTKVDSEKNMMVQLARPIVIFVGGAWLLQEFIGRSAGRSARRARGMFALVAIAGLLALADACQLDYVVNLKSLTEVSCCCCTAEAAGGKLQPAAYYLPSSGAGPASELAANLLFFGGIPLLAAWLVVRSSIGAPRRAILAISHAALLLTAAAGLAAAALAEFAAVLAPLLMRLPFHHCVYCLLFGGRAPDALLIAANLAVGTFCAGWAATVCPALQPEASATIAAACYRRCCRIGAAALVASVLMVAVHLAILRG